MFCILPCATLTDNVSLPPVGPSAALAPGLDKVRVELRKLSNTDYLIDLVSKGEVIMSRKVAIDSYLQGQVDLMRSCVSTYTPTNFAYNCFLTSGTINTAGLSPKEQWAVQIVFSRLNVSSIYQAGSFASMRIIFAEGADSYRPTYKASTELVRNLQIAFQYFNEGYQPIKRMFGVFDSIQALAGAQLKGKLLQINRPAIEAYTNLLSINLAFIKIEKLRLLHEYTTCKEAAYSVYLRTSDARKLLEQYKGKFNVLSEILDFFSLAQLFYQILAFYFLLLEHENKKDKQDFGFVKKEFQQMIVDNVAAIGEIERLMTGVSTLNHQNDNVGFGMGILKVVLEQVQKFKYRYTINVHENKIEKPSIKELVARRIGASSIWNSIDYF